MTASVIIEVKEHMANVSQLEGNFRQGVTYARLAEADLLVTCDKYQLQVFLLERFKKRR